MKCFNLFLFLSILFLNIFNVECSFTLSDDGGDGNKAIVKGSFQNDGEGLYYVAMSVKMTSPDKNYMLWFTFKTPEELKNGIQSNTDPDPVLEHTWKYNTDDPNGSKTHKDGQVTVCKMKKTFNKDAYKAKYPKTNLNREFKEMHDILKDFDDEATPSCYDMGFEYYP